MILQGILKILLLIKTRQKVGRKEIKMSAHKKRCISIRKKKEMNEIKLMFLFSLKNYFFFVVFGFVFSYPKYKSIEYFLHKF